jgi:precorrin-6B methylase 2
VAEIGAGNGAMAVRIAKKVGPAGGVFATEIDPALVKRIRERARKAGLNNVTAVTATSADSGLPADCCDAAYMIGVYHHIIDPASTDATIFRALKPGARLLINDLPPTIWLALFKVKGVPANRGGHGVRDYIVSNEITAAGFHEMKETRPWHPGCLSGTTTASYFPSQAISAMHPRNRVLCTICSCDTRAPRIESGELDCPTGWHAGSVAAFNSASSADRHPAQFKVLLVRPAKAGAFSGRQSRQGKSQSLVA